MVGILGEEIGRKEGASKSGGVWSVHESSEMKLCERDETHKNIQLRWMIGYI